MRYVVKLGGSLITHKGIEDYPQRPIDVRKNPGKYIKLDVLENIADIIDRTKKRDKNLELILVTGAGCCGHPQVKANFPPKVISEIASMPANYLSDALIVKGVKNVVLSPMYFVECLESDGKHGTKYDMQRLWECILPEHRKDEKLPYIVISHGDVAYMGEGKKGRLGDYEVVSGDDLMTYFGEAWPANKVINVSNVDGVYTEFPNKPGQKPIMRILANEKLKDNTHFKEKMESMYKVIFNSVDDVTGGLFAKARKLYDFTHRTRIQSQLVGINHLRGVLHGQHAGTLIERTV